MGDYNHDGKSEIVCAYSLDNVIYMDIIFPEDKQKTKHFQKIFLDSLKTVPGNQHKFQISDIEWADLNGDGFDEILLTMFSTYETYYPRKLKAFDVVNESLTSSIPLNNLIGNIIVLDLDGDGIPEITGSCAAPDNNKEGQEDYLLHDHSAWLMTFDNELNLIDSTPPEFVGINTSMKMLPKEVGGKTEIMAHVIKNFKEGEQDYFFTIKNLNQIIIGDTIPRLNGISEFQWFPFMDNEETAFLALRSNQYLAFINPDLKITEWQELPKKSLLLKPGNLCDGIEPEIITKEMGSNWFSFHNSSGKLLCKHLFEGMETSAGNWGLTNFTGQKTAYWMTGKSIKYFTLENNNWFYLRWLLLIGIIGILHFFSWSSILLQQRQVKQKSILIKKMRKLELQGINTQLDPHFTFNALNVLRFLANSGDTKGVEDFVMHFSKIMRQQLQSSDKPAQKLAEELNLISHYVQLQKMRYDIPIELDLTIDSDVNNNLPIPKMLIHTHVENAIKHGLLPSSNGGSIFIKIFTEKKKTIISIRDNGIGRKPGSSPDTANGHGKGLKMLEQLVDLFYQLYKVNITQEFVDHDRGTEVVIVVG